MNDTGLEQRVLYHISRPNYEPVKVRVLAKQLGLPKESHADLKKAVKQLAKHAKLAYGPGRRIRPGGASSRNQITGIFHRTAAGFGFVRPSNAKQAREKTDDIYIPARRTLDAATGDLVLVRLKRRGRDRFQRQAGEITEVIERETHQFVGTYFEEGGAGYVRIDGTLFAQPILVGDAGAKNARPDNKVVVEMVRFPSHAHAGEGVITEVLGMRGASEVDTLLVLREFDLPETFPDDVLDDARQQAEQFQETIGRDRTDLTSLPIITIDPADARDFDDAISLERLEKGHWRLGVHIADVSHFVPRRSPLDREARNRATSVYLPDRVIPMLPEIISNNLASLQPDRVRYTKTAFIEFTADGARVGTDVCSAAIRSKRRFTYEEVDDYLKHPKKWKKQVGPEIHQLLGRMSELAKILRKRRIKRGAIELIMPEIKLEMDREGHVSGARRVEHTESHQIIEEFMLAANEAVAELLRDRELYFLRRLHASPDPRKLRALTEFIRELKIPAESLESRFEIQRVLAEVADRPERDAVNYAVLRSMQKAVYGPQEEGHYALASDCYCHFTSPIRRYPDLTIHRLLGDLSAGKKPVHEFGPLLALGEHCSDREQRAEAAERELTKLKLLHYFSQRIGHQMEAVITGVASFGIFAQGIELPAEGLIHVTSLTDDYYHFDAASHTLEGRRPGNRFRLGDTIGVEIVRVDLDRRELGFRLANRQPPAATSANAKVRKKRPRPRGEPGVPKASRGGKKSRSAASTTRPRKKKSR